MMVAQHQTRLQDGENELMVVTRITPGFDFGHMHADWWTLHAVYGAKGHEKAYTLTVRNTREERDKFLNAGYTPRSIFQNTAVGDLAITVLTTWSAERGLFVDEVIHADENAPVLSEAERQEQWAADLKTFGGSYSLVGQEARFTLAKQWVTWTKNAAQQYVRITATSRTLYEGKKS